ATAIRYGTSGMHFTVPLRRKRYPFFIPIWGKHNVINALFAIAVADRLCIPPRQMQVGLQAIPRISRRITLHRVGHQVQLIDDTFSANPEATTAAIDVLCQIGQKKEKIACLGSMLDMGTYTFKAHQQVGNYLAKKKIDRIYTFGKEAKIIGEVAKKAGMSVHRIHHFKTRSAMHRHLI